MRGGHGWGREREPVSVRGCCRVCQVVVLVREVHEICEDLWCEVRVRACRSLEDWICAIKSDVFTEEVFRLGLQFVCAIACG